MLRERKRERREREKLWYLLGAFFKEAIVFLELFNTISFPILLTFQILAMR